MNIFNSYNDMFRLNNWCRNTNDPNFSLAKLENYDEVKLANIEYCYEPMHGVLGSLILGVKAMIVVVSLASTAL